MTHWGLILNKKNMAVKNKRVAISNKLRFEVFKRDSFKCQYCGKSAPEVILNADHIHPVAKGGSADILNLITSCFECNSGKSDIPLSDNTTLTLQKAQLDELNERRNQLEMLIEWKKQLSDTSYEINALLTYFNEKNGCKLSLTPSGIKDINSVLKKYTTVQIIDAINEGYDKYYGELNPSEMWAKIPRLISWSVASEFDKEKMKFFGGVKARFNGTSGYSQWQIISTNKMIKYLHEVIDENSTTLTYSKLFKILNSNHNYNGFTRDIEDKYREIKDLLAK